MDDHSNFHKNEFVVLNASNGFRNLVEHNFKAVLVIEDKINNTEVEIHSESIALLRRCI